MKTPYLGSCIFDQTILNRLLKLWNGPISPTDLEPIEMTLRAMIVYNDLIISPYSNNIWEGGWKIENDKYPMDLGNSDNIFYELSGTELEFEFKEIDYNVSYPRLSKEELAFLDKYVFKEFYKLIETIIPNDIHYEWEYIEFLDNWYSTGEIIKPTKSDWEKSNYNRISKLDFIQSGSHAIFHSVPTWESEFIIRAS
jgi:hypothetical protein